MYPVPVDFGHHEATSLWMRRINNFNEEMGMELATSLFHFALKWVILGGNRREWMLVVCGRREWDRWRFRRVSIKRWLFMVKGVRG